MPISSMVTKSNPISLLRTCRRFNFRTFSTALNLSSPPPPSAGAKLLDSFTEEFEVGNRPISFETGKIARFANGSVVMTMDLTNVLSTVTCAKCDASPGFLPLTVDYQEKQFAQGVIPNTFMRREGAPKERELLCGRLIDRPIRPLFPNGFYHEVQVMASVLSSDGKQDPDVMAANATSAALMLSDIPWGGPVGVIRVGRISGQFIINPTMDELSLSDLNLVYACTKDKTLMIDVQAREISENDLKAGLRLAHPEAVKFLEPQIRLASRAGKQKKEYTLSMMSESTMEKVKNLSSERIEAVFSDPKYGKFERGEALDMITRDVKRALQEECDEDSLKGLSKAVDTVRKQIVRKRILKEGARVDGRHLDEVRPVYCEAGNLPALHGSSLFSRGDTQVLCTVTLGAPGDAQRLESVVGPSSKRFMLHYNFPPFSINEVGKRGGLNRREVGHGTLAEKALLAVLPPENDFPYTVRVNSEVMASDGSTSMASVCGGSMALMDAGIPVYEHVAGVSVGLVSEVDPSTGEILDYRILTDILGLEDHLGDMDFKIAGTRNGITAIQLDIKPAGIPLDIICESLDPAFRGRLQILDHMDRAIKAPRTQDSTNAPRLATLKYNNDSIRTLVGPLGALKRKIEEETGARICVGDGTLTILAKNQSVMDKAQEKIDFIIGREIEVGGIYKGIVASIKEYGAFVEFNGGQQGLLHTSELSHEPVSKISDVISVGDQLSVMCIGQDVRGNVKLSRKAVLPNPKKHSSSSDEGPFSFTKPGSENWDSASQGKKSSTKEVHVTKYEVNKAKPSTSFLVRSVEECDEIEKLDAVSQGLTPSRSTPSNSTISTQTKTSQKTKTSPASRQKSECDPHSSGVIDSNEPSTSSRRNKKTKKNGSVVTAKPSTSFLIRSAEECDKQDDLDALIQGLTPSRSISSNSTISTQTETIQNTKTSPTLRQNTECDPHSSGVIDSNEPSTTSRRNKKTKTSLSVKTLKIGSVVTAKVDQIRARGLVLDLAGGIKGMYRFQENEKKDFEVGEQLKVQCCSFTSKGVPVLSQVEGD
ncbi:polyribonucleotide nucleotidyltransferase 2, mitochondrial [Silene latifolia]|uniref:polyribonucleotide nucleotidyltransferase 2, mitochondrial n=1 Tax=Silene latifolia TaxID=37657 RepID=UPI003D770F00